MKIITKILTAILCGIMLFSVVSFTACTNGDLEAKIAELEAQIADLQEQNQDLQSNVAEQQTQIATQQEQIARLEQEKQELKEEYYQILYEDYNEALKIKYDGVFNEDEEKIYWNYSPDYMFTEDSVLVVLKNPNEYVELTVEDLYLENAEKISYISGVRPPDYFFTPEYEHKLDTFNQIIQVHLTDEGKDKVIDAIYRLEQLYFVLLVEPNYLISID